MFAIHFFLILVPKQELTSLQNTGIQSIPTNSILIRTLNLERQKLITTTANNKELIEKLQHGIVREKKQM